MRLLLDTQAAIWWFSGHARLSTTARRALSDTATPPYISAASVWEASIKMAQGRLDPPDLLTAARAAGCPFLAISEEHGLLAGQLPPIHRDPFDRMLVAQARIEGLALVSADTVLPRYGVPVVW